MELQLSLSLSLSNNSNNNDKMMMMSTTKEMKKRYYSKAFDDIDEEEVNSSDVVPKTLSLFTWKPNGEDNSDNPRHHDHLSTYLNKIDSEKGVIGWPPIHRWRKKMCYNNNNENYLGGDMFINNYEIRVENGGGGNSDRIGRNRKSMYVKVKMDGVGIARKIDLTAHLSFNTLTHSLILMFPKRDERHKLIYEDKDGAWLLAGDESWGSFVETVQRLKLVKSGDKI